MISVANVKMKAMEWRVQPRLRLFNVYLCEWCSGGCQWSDWEEGGVVDVLLVGSIVWL